MKCTPMHLDVKPDIVSNQENDGVRFLKGRDARKRWLKAQEEQNLSRSCRGTLRALASYADPDGTHCFPGVKKIARSVGCTTCNVRKHLQEAKRKGFLRTRNQYRSDGSRTTNLYLFCVPASLPQKPEHLRGYRSRGVPLSPPRGTPLTTEGASTNQLPTIPPTIKAAADTTAPTAAASSHFSSPPPFSKTPLHIPTQSVSSSSQAFCRKPRASNKNTQSSHIVPAELHSFYAAWEHFDLGAKPGLRQLLQTSSSQRFTALAWLLVRIRNQQVIRSNRGVFGAILQDCTNGVKTSHSFSLQQLEHLRFHNTQPDSLAKSLSPIQGIPANRSCPASSTHSKSKEQRTKELLSTLSLEATIQRQRSNIPSVLLDFTTQLQHNLSNTQSIADFHKLIVELLEFITGKRQLPSSPQAWVAQQHALLATISNQINCPMHHTAIAQTHYKHDNHQPNKHPI